MRDNGAFVFKGLSYGSWPVKIVACRGVLGLKKNVLKEPSVLKKVLRRGLNV